jgi:hypothetical protein
MNVIETDLIDLKNLVAGLKRSACQIVSVMEEMTKEEACRRMDDAMLASAENPTPDHYSSMEKEYIELRVELSFMLNIFKHYGIEDYKLL